MLFLQVKKVHTATLLHACKSKFKHQFFFLLHSAYRMGSDGFMAPFNSTIAPKTGLLSTSFLTFFYQC